MIHFFINKAGEQCGPSEPVTLAGIITRSTPGLDNLWDDPPMLVAYLLMQVLSVAEQEGVEPIGDLTIQHAEPARYGAAPSWSPVAIEEAYFWHLTLSS